MQPVSAFREPSSEQAMIVHVPVSSQICWRKDMSDGAPGLGLLAVQPAEPPQCAVPQAACHAEPWQPAAVLVLPWTSPQRSPGAALDCDSLCALYVLV